MTEKTPAKPVYINSSGYVASSLPIKVRIQRGIQTIIILTAAYFASLLSFDATAGAQWAQGQLANVGVRMSGSSSSSSSSSGSSSGTTQGSGNSYGPRIGRINNPNNGSDSSDCDL